MIFPSTMCNVFSNKIWINYYYDVVSSSGNAYTLKNTDVTVAMSTELYKQYNCYRTITSSDRVTGLTCGKRFFIGQELEFGSTKTRVINFQSSSVSFDGTTFSYSYSSSDEDLYCNESDMTILYIILGVVVAVIVIAAIIYRCNN